MNIGLLKKILENIPDDYTLCYGPKEINVRNIEIMVEDEKIIVR